MPFLLTEAKKRLKGALKAHKHISLYESYTLQEQDATILFLGSVSNSSAPDKSSLHKLHKNVYIKQENGEIMCSNWL